MAKALTDTLERLVFQHRKLVVLLFLVMTVALGYSLSNLRVDAGFSKLLPLKHEYMQSFLKYRDEFGGANRVLVALTVKEGDIFNAGFFKTLKSATDEVFFIPGIDRSRVTSLFTPNVRFTEVVEDGISGGNIVPADFKPTPEGLEQVRKNLLKSNYVGRLVSNDFSGAIISASLLEVDPNTGEKLDYIKVAELLEKRIRERFISEKIQVDVASSPTGLGVHIIGFAKVIGDIHAGAADVKLFFAVAFCLTAVMVYIYMQSMALTAITVVCALMAVIWQLGLLPLLGFGIDPMSILVPFLVFAIAVSHGMQMVSAVRAEVFNCKSSEEAARASFRRLLLPGGIALLSDTIGFLTILFIEIEIIREMAITASLGVAVIILTNLVLLPVLLSYARFDEDYRQRLIHRATALRPVWDSIAKAGEKKPATIILVVALVMGLLGFWKGSEIRIGDLHQGVPEFHADSVYNKDTKTITERFSIGVDVLSVIAETTKDGCIDHEVMSDIDRFGWSMQNVEGVQSVISLASVARVINAGWNEGNLKWRELSRNQHMMVQSVAHVPTSTGLLNKDCSVMPVLIFTKDHKAETISRIVDAVKHYRGQYASDKVRYQLASNNVGVMAATNEAVQAAQFPILIYVFAAIIILCLITFRSLAATLCVVLPLGLVSLLAYALMAWQEIGLKVNTLPVVALGVGIGVDYGIYIFSRLQSLMKQGMPFTEAFRLTLAITGSGVVFTAVILAFGVMTWIFSDLKFQADMGIMLTFMFLVNMLGSILLLPALAAWLLPERLKVESGIDTSELDAFLSQDEVTCAAREKAST
ncbi:MAG: MMPL family transporter [Gammaproteobacteria bacterium]|nr:MMPL family transporter [Gammaproteobacteria bacterium]